MLLSRAVERSTWYMLKDRASMADRIGKQSFRIGNRCWRAAKIPESSTSRVAFRSQFQLDEHTSSAGLRSVDLATFRHKDAIGQQVPVFITLLLLLPMDLAELRLFNSLRRKGLGKLVLRSARRCSARFTCVAGPIRESYLLHSDKNARGSPNV